MGGLPLYLAGYDTGVLAGVVVGFTALALFQHANVRLRFRGLRWVINTPEWHHWHHALDAEARDKNFGLPVVDLIFGTAYMPRDCRPSGFGTAPPGQWLCCAGGNRQVTNPPLFRSPERSYPQGLCLHQVASARPLRPIQHR